MEIEQALVRVNGIDMHVEMAGAGRPLLLLHGFPDSGRLWHIMVPALVAAGFRVIMPDQRGFGLTTAPLATADYDLGQMVADAVGLLDALGIARADLMAHDWGAVIGWQLAIHHPDRFHHFVALAVGHPNALASAGIRQKLKSWYVLFFQWRRVAERLLAANDFALLGLITRHEPEIVRWRQDLARPGRLTAALNWYRANYRQLVRTDFGAARIPVMGFIGTDDVALTQTQMIQSGRYVAAPFHYQRVAGAGHWLPLHAAAQITAPAIAFLTNAG